MKDKLIKNGTLGHRSSVFPEPNPMLSILWRTKINQWLVLYMQTKYQQTSYGIEKTEKENIMLMLL